MADAKKPRPTKPLPRNSAIEMPTPIFRVGLKTKEENVSIDERSVDFLLDVRVSGVDWQQYRLENVQVRINAASIPENVLVDGISKPTATGLLSRIPSVWYPLGPPFSMEEAEPKGFVVIVKTGLFAAIQQAIDAGKPLTITNNVLEEFPSAKPGKIQFETEVSCLVRPIDGYKPQAYASNSLTFTVNKD